MLPCRQGAKEQQGKHRKQGKGGVSFQKMMMTSARQGIGHTRVKEQGLPFGAKAGSQQMREQRRGEERDQKSQQIVNRKAP